MPNFSRTVSRDFLRSLPSPQSLGRFHRPIRFDTIVDTLCDMFNSDHVTIGLNPKGTKLYGILELGCNHETFAGTIGFRSSSDETFGLGIVAGTRVFICENGAFSGDETILKNHHTLHFNLAEALARRMPDISQKIKQFEDKFVNLQQAYLTDNEACALIVNAIRIGAFPANDCKKVADLYFAPNPSPESVGYEGTAWSLLNAFTRVMKDHPEQVRYGRTIAIGKLFGL